jgi:hypothetical protein
MNDELLKISLTQGKEFNSYQTKLKNGINKSRIKNKKKEGFQNVSFEQEQMVRPSFDGYVPALKHMKQRTSLINNINQKDLDELKELQSKYDDLILQYTNIQKTMGNSSLDIINRVSANNPYLNKTIRFTTGQLAYVTNQGVVKYIPSQEVLKSVNIPQEYIDVSLPWDSTWTNNPGQIIPTNPTLVSGTSMQMSQTVGDEGTNVYVNQLISSNVSPNYMGCYTSNSSVSFIGESPSTSEQGNYTYNDCLQASVNEGYQYFGLQNINPNNSKGFCAVSNSETDITSLGESTIPTKSIPIWASNTYNQPGNMAILTNTGSLSVVNTSGKSMFTSPGTEAQPGNYLGCYGDAENRAMELYNNTVQQQYNLAQCQQFAKDSNSKYFGLQNSTSGINAQCTLSNDLDQAFKYGKATNCTKLADNSYSGGAWSNAIYSTTNPESNYYLILEDDGNMCIYRGTGPYDNQGTIWCSQTNGKQQKANSNMTATKSKYGQNWMKSGTTLAPGEFVSSNNGDIVLLMQPDGNLVLYTYNMEPNCKKMNDGFMGGGTNANAVYNIGQKGVIEDLGLLAYIDPDSNLKEYPDTMLGFTNDYQIYQNSDSLGNDIASLITNDQNGCQDACNNNTECAAYVYQGSSQTCWLKNNQSYPRGEKTRSDTQVLGVRKPSLKTSSTCSNKISNIDSIQYNNYLKGSPMTADTQCNQSVVNQEDKLKYDNIKNQLIILGQDIALKMEKLYNQDNKIHQRFNTNAEQFKKDIQKYKLTNQKINYELSNMEGMSNMNMNMNDLNGMLSDSDIRILQANYSYIMWSILAIGILTITINTIKK